jgi:ribosome assembly protein YihI (activator of Der GTPase)
MTRQKKTRTSGPLAPTQKPRVKNTIRDELSTHRKKKPKGFAPGSRNSQEKKTTADGKSLQQQDPRHGSKRPVSLAPAPEQPVTPLKPQVVLKKAPEKVIEPEQELLAIENDQRLLALLERVDNDEVLTGKDAKYFNAKTARHQELMALLGFEDDEDEDDFDEDFTSDDRSLAEQWQDDDTDE